MTASTISANMATGRVLPMGNGQPLAPAWVRSPKRQICEGSRPRADKLLNQANWWARPVPATTTDRSTTGHAEAARSSLSHVGSPAPSLAVLHPGAPQRHTHRSSHRDVPNRGDQGGPRLRPARPVAPTALRPDHGFSHPFPQADPLVSTGASDASRSGRGRSSWLVRARNRRVSRNKSGRD
jgi:hypothetical protein